jgi:protease I
MNKKKVGFIIANLNFRDEEYFYPKDVIEKAGFKALTISMEKAVCIGKLGGEVVADLAIRNVIVDDFDAIVFVGGSGCQDFWHNEYAHKICRKIVEQEKVLGAICSSVATLAFAGVLNGVNVNSYETEREILKDNGGVLSDLDVVVDDKHKIISANGPKVSRSFGLEIVKMINKK